MKFIYLLLLSFFITFTLHSQDCKTLDKKLFFTSVQFGNQIPVDLSVCSKKAKIQYQYYSDYRIEYDSLNQDCKDKYSDLFTFLSMPFAFLQTSTNKRGQIFFIELYSFFDDNSREPKTYDLPPNFTSIYKKLVSLYGKPTRTEEATTTDSLFIRELGMPKIVAWECNNIFLQLRVRYGSRQRALNVIDIQITNRQFDVPEPVLFPIESNEKR